MKKSIKKYNFKKDLMNLTETNNQIRMLSGHSVSSNNSFKSLWMLAVVQLQLCESWLNLTQGLLQGWRKRTKVMWIRLQEKTQKNSYYQLFQQKHNLTVIVMEKLLMWIKLVSNFRKKRDIEYIQTAPREGAIEYIGEGLHYKKIPQCKTSCTLKIDVFEIPDNKNIEKVFSEYELLSLDQSNSSPDPSLILILQFPIARASLPPSIFMSNF